MEHQTAVKLIAAGVDRELTNQRWADLGAGEGTFTYALSSLLDSNSEVYAIDKNQSVLSKIKSLPQCASIKIVTADFLTAKLDIPKLNGILLANSLHYVKDKISFLKSMRATLLNDGRMIIVEYDTLEANVWVPYPIDFQSLATLAKQVGCKEIRKLGEQPSKYRVENLYAALVT
jgi:ubiquinone/menaquinone biosynthesis C-methylase UbiE